MKAIKIYKTKDNECPLYNIQIGNEIVMKDVDLTTVLEFLSNTDCEVEKDGS